MTVLVSAVIPTYKREYLLQRAVASCLVQATSDVQVEVVVVNDAGAPLCDAEWRHDPRVLVVDTNHVERCFARNTGASLSHGQYLHFLDDDDMLLPGAYESLLAVAIPSGAEWVYGAYEVVDDNGDLRHVVHPSTRGRIFAVVLAGGVIHLGASLISRAAFFDVCGFDPKFVVSEDKEFLQRISMNGRLEFTEHMVARIRSGPEGATTTRWELAKEMGRLVREKAMCSASCGAAMTASLNEHKDDGIRGRIVRYYFGSAARHWRDGMPLVAADRFGTGLRIACPRLFSPKLWACVRASGEPGAGE